MAISKQAIAENTTDLLESLNVSKLNFLSCYESLHFQS